MKQTDPQFKLRLPQGLKDRLESAATSNHRSLTAEIVARLEDSFSEPEKIALPLTTRIRREALSGEESEQATPGGEKHELTDEQLWKVINDVLDSVTGRERLPGRPTKGPTPRGRFPKK